MREKILEYNPDEDIDIKNPGFDHIEGEIDFNRMIDEIEEDKLEILLGELERPHHEMPGEREAVEVIIEPELDIKLVIEKVATDGRDHDIVCWKKVG